MCVYMGAKTVQHNYGSHDAGTKMGQCQFSFLSIYIAGITPEVKYMREIRMQWHQDTNATLCLGEQEEVRISA